MKSNMICLPEPASTGPPASQARAPLFDRAETLGQLWGSVGAHRRLIGGSALAASRRHRNALHLDRHTSAAHVAWCRGGVRRLRCCLGARHSPLTTLLSRQPASPSALVRHRARGALGQARRCVAPDPWASWRRVPDVFPLRHISHPCPVSWLKCARPLFGGACRPPAACSRRSSRPWMLAVAARAGIALRWAALFSGFAGSRGRRHR